MEARRVLLFLITLTGYWACQTTEAPPPSEKTTQTLDPNSPAAMVRIPLDDQGMPDSTQVAQITFDESKFDFGTVKEGDIVEHTFYFTNTGKVGLIIYEAKSSCGCTVPESPRELIPPGGRNKITAKFNTTDKPGSQVKTISVQANSIPAETILSLSGQVIPKS